MITNGKIKKMNPLVAPSQLSRRLKLDVPPGLLSPWLEKFLGAPANFSFDYQSLANNIQRQKSEDGGRKEREKWREGTAADKRGVLRVKPNSTFIPRFCANHQILFFPPQRRSWRVRFQVNQTLLSGKPSAVICIGKRALKSLIYREMS